MLSLDRLLVCESSAIVISPKITLRNKTIFLNKIFDDKKPYLLYNRSLDKTELGDN